MVNDNHCQWPTIAKKYCGQIVKTWYRKLLQHWYPKSLYNPVIGHWKCMFCACSAPSYYLIQRWLMSIGSLGANFGDILMREKMSSAKYQYLCHGLDVSMCYLTILTRLRISCLTPDIERCRYTDPRNSIAIACGAFAIIYTIPLYIFPCTWWIIWGGEHYFYQQVAPREHDLRGTWL